MTPDSQPIDGLWRVIRRFVLVRWRALGAATALGLVATGLNVASLAVFAAIPQVLSGQIAGLGVPGAAAPAGGTAAPGGLDIRTVLARIGTFAGEATAHFGMVEAVLLLSAVYLVVVFLTRAVALFADRIILTANEETVADFSHYVFSNVIRLSLDFFHLHKVGDLFQRICGDCTNLAMSVFETVKAIVTSLPMFLFYSGLLLVISWQLTLGALTILVLKTVAATTIARRVGRNATRLGNLMGFTGARVQEALHNITVIKAYGGEQREAAEYRRLIKRYQVQQTRGKFLQRLDGAVQTFLQSVTMVSIAILGVVLLLAGNLEPITLIVYFFAALRLQEPTRNLLEFVRTIHRARGCSVRVFSILGHRSSVTEGSHVVDGFRSEIRFEGVGLAYQPDRPALAGIDLSLRKGEVLAVVGASGAGKSSLINLLLRFYEPGEGRILIDGIDVREATLASYRRLFAVVTQEPMLFHATIRDNIAYGAGDRAVTDVEVGRAARLAHADEFIESRAEGYDAMIGDRGVRLSGGQKQRIALARAIVRDAPILVLDEATSALDGHSERQVQDAVDRFLEGRTCVIVAHRFSTIRKADRIVVLDEGRIVEEGDLDSLMARRGAFWRLYRAQAGAAPEPSPASLRAGG